MPRLELRRPAHRSVAGSALDGRADSKWAATVLANERWDKCHFGRFLKKKGCLELFIYALQGCYICKSKHKRSFYQLLQHLMQWPCITASCHALKTFSTWDFSPRLP
ncbi:hypothetical protein CDV31_016412 [Fusarium ambrosium]|uniref:Uncharacterized protein n=1 Tax=Fusarium ambrosium TaxID=131363 RepID=A0A428S9L1_9HYPO|nr:hypothetical protein CDV31_016412 [Fusarium ambrosium]